MKQHRKKLLLTLALLLTAAGLWFARPRPDPIYQGKPMSQWLRELETDSIRAKSEAVDTLVHADPVVVPALLDGLRRRDSRVLRAAWLRMPTFIQRRLTPPRDYTLLHSRCVFLLGYIAPASPEVVRDLRCALASDEEGLPTLAAQALRMIADREAGGTPELRKALPDLRRLLTTRKDVHEQFARAAASIDLERKHNQPVKQQTASETGK
jgi:hypothetical protein